MNSGANELIDVDVCDDELVLFCAAAAAAVGVGLEEEEVEEFFEKRLRTDANNGLSLPVLAARDDGPLRFDSGGVGAEGNDALDTNPGYSPLPPPEPDAEAWTAGIFIMVRWINL